MALASERSESCGVYYLESLRDGTEHFLTEVNHRNGQQIHYRIINDEDDSILMSMVHGKCYCVTGESKLDHRYNGDRSYRTLHVERIVRGPSGC